MIVPAIQEKILRILKLTRSHTENKADLRFDTEVGCIIPYTIS